MMQQHIPVMLNECLDGLNIKPDGIYVDGTLGRGGHSSEILKRLKTGHLYCFDIDEQALNQSQERLSEIGNQFTLIKANFADMKNELNALGIEKVDGILLDIGVSSPQFDDGERGFSYRYDARLDMRMDQSQPLDAYTIVNQYSFNDLCRIISQYGEEPYAKSIARNIEKARMIAPVETTFQLVEIIKKSMPAKALNKQGHPEKQTFQALRIAVNDELGNLSRGLDGATELLDHQGRLAVISFHSLEDEIVKRKFKELSSPIKLDKRLPIKASDIPQPDYSLVNKKPILAGEEELEINHRAKSAKLRILERR